MLYPLLKNDTLFPGYNNFLNFFYEDFIKGSCFLGGLNGENLDMIFQNAHIDASRRSFRAMSEVEIY